MRSGIGAAVLLAVGLTACRPDVTADAGVARPVDAGRPRDAFESLARGAVLPAVEPAADFGDLPRIVERKRLRILVEPDGDQFLPREGSPQAVERALLAEWCQRLGVEAEFIGVERFDRFLPMLLEGRGDVAAAMLTVTAERQKQVAFTRPLKVVDEVLVERKGGSSPTSLAGLEVHVRESSAFAKTLRDADAGVRVVAVPETDEPEQTAFEVSQGQRPYTVLDRPLFEAIAAYNGGLQVAFPVATGRQLAWAVHPAAKKLKAALDQFIVEVQLQGQARQPRTPDLDGIKKRGVLRVLTRNNAVTYFLHRGQPFGFDYELAKLLADELKVRLEVVVPPEADQLVPWLLEGRGDLIAASFTRTESRAKQVAFSVPYLWVNELVVQKKGAPLLTSLKGQRVSVRKSSSYWETLSREGTGAELVEVAEDVETEELLEQVAAGEIPLTVADSHLVQAELASRDDLQVAFPLWPEDAGAGRDGPRPIAFAVRPSSVKLAAFVDRWVPKLLASMPYALAKARYFRNSQRIAEAKASLEHGALSEWDELLRRVSAEHGLDWRLAAAQAYQESRFDARAVSPMGALGLFQVLPSTGQELGYKNLLDPGQCTRAGLTYLDRLEARFEPGLPFKERVRFALAAYNAGMGHVTDARRLAQQQGLDPNQWFGNVERAMLLLQQPRHYRGARFGFVRGTEPVNYVSEIQQRYVNYCGLVE